VNWYAYCDSNPINNVDPAGLDVGDKEIYAITPTAAGEIERANVLAGSGAAYGNTPGMGGKVLGMNLSEYGCTGAMSAGRQI
jgi:hypothetical protein